ncbi:MAG: DUF554 domain-containing protein [Caldiserica bacterium]|jgi:uncharacterized membrane protein YqgA involved in biofilm formation|nr:DUF554 domain-containing protein [Caldisericota bacterium]MDH7562670.1 DUF554 domain-containing protein [Caldisericota bacterium]
MVGTLVNTGSIIAGSLVGFLASKKLKTTSSPLLTQAMGLLTSILGFQMALKANSSSLMLTLLLSLVLGAIIGELLHIEEFLERLGERASSLLKFQGGGIARGFVAATLLFCVGPMAILGSISDGLKGDFQLLLLKSIMDGTASVFLTSTLGIGVIFSAVPLFLYQGGLTLLARFFAAQVPESLILALTVSGGAIIVLLGFHFLGVKKFKVANFLPALILAPIFQEIFQRLIPG